MSLCRSRLANICLFMAASDLGGQGQVGATTTADGRWQECNVAARAPVA
jgi:hypothetical protein